MVVAPVLRVSMLCFATAFPALACSCRQAPICNLIDRPVVFIGEVVTGGVASIRDDPWYSKGGVATFRVLESFRGLPKGAKTVDV
jgi:hypothetical protein